MGYGKGKTEGGHKRGHSAMAYWVTHQEAKAEARKRRRLVAHRLERQATLEAGTASPHEAMQHQRLNATERRRAQRARRRRLRRHLRHAADR